MLLDKTLIQNISMKSANKINLISIDDNYRQNANTGAIPKGRKGAAGRKI